MTYKTETETTMMKNEKGIAREARRKVGTGAGTLLFYSELVAEEVR